VMLNDVGQDFDRFGAEFDFILASADGAAERVECEIRKTVQLPFWVGPRVNGSAAKRFHEIIALILPYGQGAAA